MTPDTPPASRRRTLLAATTAILLGSGITAGAAASVADFVPSEPDERLIRLCSKFVDLELRWRAIYDSPNGIGDDDEADALSASISKQMKLMMCDIKQFNATSPAGVLALAQALAVTNGDFGSSFDCRDTIPGCLLECLLRDAAALARGAN